MTKTNRVQSLNLMVRNQLVFWLAKKTLEWVTMIINISKPFPIKSFKEELQTTLFCLQEITIKIEVQQLSQHLKLPIIKWDAVSILIYSFSNPFFIAPDMVGPGSYLDSDKKDFTSMFKPKQGLSNVQFGNDPRWKPSNNNVPGPGQYNEPNKWNQRTYNLKFLNFQANALQNSTETAANAAKNNRNDNSTSRAL